MDHAVWLVQTYLQPNGDFTSAQSPIIASAGRSGTRAITDLGILAFRFPGGLPVAEGRGPHSLNVNDRDQHDPRDPQALMDRLGRRQRSRGAGAASRRRGDAARGSGAVIAVGSFPPGSPVPPCRIISLGHVLEVLQPYVHRHNGLRHLQFKDPAFGFLMTLKKARRGRAGRRGKDGVEVVSAPAPRRPFHPRHKRRNP